MMTTDADHDKDEETMLDYLTGKMRVLPSVQAMSDSRNSSLSIRFPVMFHFVVLI